MHGAGLRRSGALKDVCAPVRHGAAKDVCTRQDTERGEKQDEYRKKEYGMLSPARSV